MDLELIAKKRDELLKQAASFDERRVQIEKAHADCIVNIQRIGGALGLLNEMEAEAKKAAEAEEPAGGEEKSGE